MVFVKLPSLWKASYNSEHMSLKFLSRDVHVPEGFNKKNELHATSRSVGIMCT